MDINWSEILTQLINYALPMLAAWLISMIALLVGKVTPILVEKVHASFSADQIAQAKALAQIAVTYVEQLGQRPDVHGVIVNKRKLAEDNFTNALYSRGIHISAHDVEAMIESAVFQYTNQGKLLEVQSNEVKVSQDTVPTMPVETAQPSFDPTGGAGYVADRETVMAPPASSEKGAK